MDKESVHSKKTMSDMVVTHKKTGVKPVSSKSIEVVKKVKLSEQDFHVEKYRADQFAAADNDDTPEYEGEVPDFIEPHRSRYENESRGKGGTGCVFWCIAFICIIALIIGIGGFFMHATVTITPKKFTGPVNLPITLSQTRMVNDVTFATATKTFTDESIIPATSFATQTSNATGTIRFYNATTRVQSIKKGTIVVSSAGVQYTTSTKVVIPAQKGKVPGQVNVLVTAVQSGSGGNSGLDDFTFLTPSKALLGVTIRSTTPMSGGQSGQDAVADSNQITQAENTLEAKFSDTTMLVQRMAEEIPADMIVLPIAFPASAPLVTTEANHDDGVHVIAKETVTILLVNRYDIASVLGSALSVPTNTPLDLESFDGLTVTTGSIISNLVVPQTMVIRVSGTGTVLGFVDTQKIRVEIAGISRKASSDKLKTEQGIGSFTIHMSPFWRRILPLDAGKISVKVNNP